MGMVLSAAAGVALGWGSSRLFARSLHQTLEGHASPAAAKLGVLMLLKCAVLGMVFWLCWRVDALGVFAVGFGAYLCMYCAVPVVRMFQAHDGS